MLTVWLQDTFGNTSLQLPTYSIVKRLLFSLVVGCKFSDKIIYPETFANNPDSYDKVFSTELGIYKPNCGLDNVMLSWGHDEVTTFQSFSSTCANKLFQYLYNVFKNQSTLPTEALAMIRYHSFYPWHREGAYKHLMNEKDEQLLVAVQAFNPYDLYSKNDEPCDVEKLRPYYQNLISKYFPPELDW